MIIILLLHFEIICNPNSSILRIIQNVKYNYVFEIMILIWK